MRWMIALFVVGSLGCAQGGGAGAAGGADHANELALIKTSKIEVTDAIKAAQAKVPGRVIDTELKSKNGRTVWEVDIAKDDGKASEVDVDAASGQVLDTE